MTDHDALDELAASLTEEEADTFDDLESEMRRREAPIAARVFIDGDATSVYLPGRSSADEAAMESLWRRSWRANGGGGPDAA